MTLEELKKKVLSLIEEIDTTQVNLTSDVDIATKLPHVINQVLSEMSRMKKIPEKAVQTITIEDGTDTEELDLTTLTNFFQLNIIKFINEEGKSAEFEIIDNLVIFKEEGTATIYYYKYPTKIDTTTVGTTVLELSDDALEVAVYGIAGDLLKSDPSNAYGNVYMQRYQQMKQELDPRMALGTVFIEGGITI